jgi:hypothetical protein
MAPVTDADFERRGREMVSADTTHQIMTTALTHPFQVLTIGMIVSRGVSAAISVGREKWRRRRPDSVRRPVRPTAADPTAARVAM